MTHVSLNDFKARMAEHLDRIEADRTEMVVTRPDHEPFVVMTLAELEALRETLHLLSTPANADRLLRGTRDLDAGNGRERDLVDP